MECCPTTVSNVAGLYLRAETTKFSIYYKCVTKQKYFKILVKVTYKTIIVLNKFYKSVEKQKLND
ncbi:MAG: hypothetical protein Kow0079_14790 [Vicingaceae bacterium]